MRIISGVLGGRVFKAPNGNKTHPMSEKIRGAMFNSLGDISGLTVLDAFSGSGAVAIEAFSRGAEHVVAVDSSKDAFRTIVENTKTLRINRVKAIQANVSSWSDNNPDAKFDIVVCDPPYDDVQLAVIKKMEKHTKTGGVFIVSLPPMKVYETDLSRLLEKDYNDAKLYFYRKMS